jgi:ADP-ribose pyrophosphatase YjhB (NUDIX family)
MLVRESLITEKKQLQLSAGLAVLQKGAILLGHPKGQEWYGTYSIPKGHVEEGEDLLEAAIRETREEVGITVDVESVLNPTEPRFIDYKDKDGNLYKRVYYFFAAPADPIKQSQIIPDKAEIDWAGFILPEDAEARIFWRLKPILDEMEEYQELVDQIQKDEEEAKEEAVDVSAEEEGEEELEL